MNFCEKVAEVGERMKAQSVSLKQSLLEKKIIEVTDNELPEGINRLFYNHSLNKSEVFDTLFEDKCSKNTFTKKIDKAIAEGHVDEPIFHHKKHLYTRFHIAQILDYFEFPKFSDNHLPFVLNIANHKGGVGKSTTTVTLAIKMALDLDLNAKVVIVDLDPQGSSARGIIQVDESGEQHYITIADLQCFDREDEAEPNQVKELIDNGLDYDDIVLASAFNTHLPNLDVITAFPSDEKFSDYFFESDEKKQVQLITRLREKIIPVLQSKYDIIILDLPPQNSPIVWSAFEASNGVITPLAPKAYDYASTESFLPTIGNAVSKMPGKGKDIQYFRILATNYDEREKHERKIYNQLINSVGEDLIPTAINHSPLFLEAAGQNCTIYDIKKSESRCTALQYDEAIYSSNAVYKTVIGELKRKTFKG
ncbi:ParA family protein [uncultured Vibrio sp.]|uniref:ParA family protein n=1 Tax=uncultured Vibrio sp. TaxID=114054 RepID=UPI00260635CC|nr:ParA family protein [uncultured Vibrio sp.]